MSFLSKNPFLQKIGLNDSVHYKTKSKSSQKEEKNRKTQPSIDLCSEDINSNLASNKNKNKLLYKMYIDDNKRKSKISMKIEENNNKENIEPEFNEEDYYCDFEENCISDELDEINYNHTDIKKFNIYFYLQYNKRKQFIIPIGTESFNGNSIRIIDLIKYIIYKINNSNIMIKHNDIDYSISLKNLDDDDEEKKKMEFYNDNYEIKPFEFWTKNNCPSYETSSLLSAINEENITFVSKNTLNVMIIKKF